MPLTSLTLTSCYFPLFLISYLIMTLPQVCSAEVSLNALHHTKGQRGINQHPQRGSRRAESRGTFWPWERSRGLVLNLGRVAGLLTRPTLNLLKENAESPGKRLPSQEPCGAGAQGSSYGSHTRVQQKAKPEQGQEQPSASAPLVVLLSRAGPSRYSFGCTLTYQMVCCS